MKNMFLKILIYFLEKELLSVYKTIIPPEQEIGLMAQMWDIPAFRNYVLDRNTKIMYNLAGGAGLDPEPREKYLMKMGQRVEILLLANRAKAAYDKRSKLAKEKNKDTE